MRLYLVRHGEARPDTEDPARPLTERGRAQVEAVARTARARAIEVAEIRHSGLLRARQTAEILATHLGSAAAPREAEGLRPNDDPEIARAECELATAPLILVGHLPHLGRLAARLTGRRAEIALEPGAMLCLGRTERRWEVEWLIQ